MFNAPEKTMTLDEFLAFVESQDDDKSYELHQGELIEVSHSKAAQTVIAGRLIYQISRFLDDNNIGGTVASSDGGFKIPPKDFYAPDMSYYSKVRVPTLPENDFFRIAPDLAAEVVSTSDSYSAHDKAMRYLQLGVKLAWVIYPKRLEIECYQPENGGVRIVILKINNTLDGGDVLPGFSLPVGKIFGL